MKKSNYSYIGISFIILVFGIYFIPKIMDRINHDDITRDESRTDYVKGKKATPSDLAYIEINGKKKKVPHFSFVNQDGKTITDKDYEGKVYVIEFFFTTCPTICPRMNTNLVKIQNEFIGNDDFGVASFTINPEHDTPEVLKEYAQKYGVTNPNWNLMTGNQEDIYKLANEGFNLYTAQDSTVVGGFEHSGNVALIDKKGFIRSRVVGGNPIIFYNGMISEAEQVDETGMEQEITMLKEDIAKLLKE
ncbi:photosynthetic protein synthase II [Yeosuana aromativorans]|uniref:Photosynthetic protein synthase II n=1 Tax=Yeosuana aromativorans TaxID=288019 RepID=A0A8J3FDS9_9FLAO|nr:SCO family protein [Yeosuana aromativorans]GGK12653.1 photosynthetic protein synthase II [Yeosuana aromativorans]